MIIGKKGVYVCLAKIDSRGLKSPAGPLELTPALPNQSSLRSLCRALSPIRSERSQAPFDFAVPDAAIGCSWRSLRLRLLAVPNLIVSEKSLALQRAAKELSAVAADSRGRGGAAPTSIPTKQTFPSHKNECNP